MSIDLKTAAHVAKLARIRVEEEALPVRKAFEMWGWDNGQVTLDPQTAGWPSPIRGER